MARNRNRAARRNERRTKQNQETRLAMQNRYVSEEANPPPTVVRVGQSPLERYRDRGTVTIEQYKAGVDFALDYERARVIGPTPVRASAWDVRSGAPGAELTERQAAQYQRYRRAVQALGPHLGAVCEAVCCYGQTCDVWASCYRLSRHDATAWLRLGLEILAEHYGYFRRPNRRSIPVRETVLQ